MCSGKSTLAITMAKQNSFETEDIDLSKHNYIVANKNYDSNRTEQLEKEKGWKAAHDYSESHFLVKNMKAIFSSLNNNEIIQIGGRQTHFKTLDEFLDCDDLLQEYPNVFLILPCDDLKKAEKILAERIIKRDNPEEKDLEAMLLFNKELIHSRTTWKLKKHVIYTECKSEEEIINEIVAKYNLSYKNN